MKLKPIVNLSEAPSQALWLDARFRLNDAGAGKKLFLAEHIPGAHHVDLDTELSGEKSGRNGRHPLPPREDLAELFSRLGIGADTHVIAYDDADHAGAARLWALLQWLGHDRAQVLDGGLAAWKRAGRPVESGEAKPREPRNFIAKPSLLKFFQKHELKGLELVDARAPERYRGETEPLDPKAGHIPGAKNLFYKDLLQTDGTFLGDAEIFKKLAPLKQPTFYCGSGVTAAVLLLAAKHVGKEASLYPGSWSEWSQDPDASVATGADA